MLYCYGFGPFLTFMWPLSQYIDIEAGNCENSYFLLPLPQQAQPRRAEAGFLTAWWDHIGIVLLQRARSGTMQ